MRNIERAFESILWGSRFLTLIAVVASLVTSIVLFVFDTVDVAFIVRDAAHHLGDGVHATRAIFYNEMIARIASVLDGYLFATIMLIFALGLYELFVSKIEVAESSEFAQRILVVSSLDDLKDRLAKVVFLILIVRYFEYALNSQVDGPLDLLYRAAGIGIIALALYLTSKK